MRHEGHKGHKGHHKDKHQIGEGDKRKDHHKHGAKTFRRGRAIAFLEMLNIKRSTLQQQLNSPELKSINPVIVGELKAIEMVINEFVHLFELYESEEIETYNKTDKGKSSLLAAEKSLDNDDKGMI